MVVLDLRLAAALADGRVALSGEAQRVPEAHGRLHAELVLGRPER